MNRIKVSLICTLKNEEASIKEFIDSLLSQSRPPDEIIIVDGGSTDKTAEVIQSYIENDAPIKLIIEDGANIAEGRNIAIKNAKYDIIASTDAGCRIDENWLQNLVRPFEKDLNVDVVSGVYESFGETTFERCVAELTGGNVDAWTAENFLPSSRSIAFKKEAWKKVGGYPEFLYMAEDTVFDLNLKKDGCKFEIAKDAIVYWRMRPNFRDLIKQTYNYAKWDTIAGICGYTSRIKTIATFSILAIVLGVTSYYNLYYGTSLIITFSLYYFLRYGVTLFMKFKTIS